MAGSGTAAVPSRKSKSQPLFAWVTWRELRQAVTGGAKLYASQSSADRAVRRLVALLETVLEWHDKEPA